MCEFALSRLRFAAGDTFQRRGAKLGQVYGHIVRVLDHASFPSQCWVPYDWVCLLVELSDAGWGPELFCAALRKLRLQRPNTEGIMRLTELMIQVVSLSRRGWSVWPTE